MTNPEHPNHCIAPGCPHSAAFGEVYCAEHEAEEVARIADDEDDEERSGYRHSRYDDDVRDDYETERERQAGDELR